MMEMMDHSRMKMVLKGPKVMNLSSVNLLEKSTLELMELKKQRTDHTS